MSDYFYSLGCCCIRYWKSVDDAGYYMTMAALSFAANEENE